MKSNQVNAKELLNRIIVYESKYPVSRWKIGGVYIWPILRQKLFTFNNTNPDIKQVTNLRRLGKLKSIYFFLNAHFKAFFLFFSADRLFAGSFTHRVVYDGQQINKYFDFAIQNEFKNNVVVYEYGVNNNLPYFNASRIVFSDFLFAFKIPFIQNGIINEVNLPEYESFLAEIKSREKFTDKELGEFSINEVKQYIRLLLYKMRIIKFYLSISNISICYICCYYSRHVHPLILAAKELKMKIVDIQHGGIGEGHFAYDNWSSCPPGGYNLLPDFFWVWDEKVENMIAKSNVASTSLPICNGNPWSSVSISLFKMQITYQRVGVLIGLTQVALDTNLIELIKLLGQEFRVTLRMHPRQYQKKSQLEEQLGMLGFNSFCSIENPFNIPLQVSIINHKIFISKASGSVLEAIEIGVIPILLDSPISNYYDQYILDGKVVSALGKTSNEILAIVHKAIVNYENDFSIITTQKHKKIFSLFEKKVYEIS